MTGHRQTVLRILAGRIILFGLVAMAIQFALVLAEYWFDDDNLSRRLIEIETEALGGAVRSTGTGLAVELPPSLARYSGATIRRAGDDGEDDDDAEDDDDMRPGYYARIRTTSGVVLYSNCGEECTEHFLPLSLNPPSFWLRTMRPGKPLTFAGGRTLDVGGQTVHAELAVVDDPAGLVFEVLYGELVEHMLAPMTLMFVLVFGATIVSVRQALSPVSVAAAEADAIDPRDPRGRLSTDGMPREIAHLAQAVNRALDRIGELIRAQRLFASAIAHEIRTPVAVVRMELEHIDHPRAAKAIGDLDQLTHVLEQLTALARLEGVEAGAFRPVALDRLAEDVVAAIAPLVFDRGKSISFVDNGAAPAQAVPALVENLIRNLVENAVRHTPAGTSITVEAGPGPAVSVCDDGPGFAATEGEETEAGRLKAAGGVGIGLRIVERIAGLHGARLSRGNGPDGRGTRITVTFRPAVTG